MQPETQKNTGASGPGRAARRTRTQNNDPPNATIFFPSDYYIDSEGRTAGPGVRPGPVQVTEFRVSRAGPGEAADPPAAARARRTAASQDIRESQARLKFRQALVALFHSP
jgi:hypothetical protein